MNRSRTIAASLGSAFVLLAAMAACGPEQSAVVVVDADDPEMKAAAETAKRRWPEFEQAFARRAAGEYFGVKVPFPTAAGDDEFIWIDVQQISGGRVHGTLGNEPEGDIGFALGDSVDRPVADVTDWIIARDGAIVAGGFQAEILERRSSP